MNNKLKVIATVLALSMITLTKSDCNYSAPHLEYIDFWAKRRK